MDAHTIIENNKLIAEFMGYPTKHYWWHHPNHEQDNCLPVSINIDICKFHSSWDWLMSVVDKLENTELQGASFTIDIMHSNITVYGYGEAFEFGSAIIAQVDVTDKLSSTYECIVKFIKWYNENSKTQK